MSEFLIREATDDDGPALSRLIADVFAEYDGCLFEPAEFPELERPASAYSERGGRLWVVAREDALVGALAVAVHHRPQEFEIFKVYLDKSVRGQGLAAALLAGANAFAAASGGERLSLWTDTRFTDGHGFYERHGFTRMPGVRALHDVSDTLEFHYAKDVETTAA